MAYSPSSPWGVTLSSNAGQAPQIQCSTSLPNNGVANCFLGTMYGRMIGPRYPHSWIHTATATCADYAAFWSSYSQTVINAPTGNERGQVDVRGSVGPSGTPAIAVFAADDPDDADLTYGAGDQFRIIFDKATDRSNSTIQGVYEGGRLYVDGLFAFNAQLGQDYSGAWADDSQFVVTVLDPTFRKGPVFGSDGTVDQALSANCTISLRTGLTVRNKAGTSDAVNGTSPPLSGDAGLDRPPAIVSIVGVDPDFGDATVGYGDSITITLDLATDMGGAAQGAFVGEAGVDALFNFSAALGHAYGGSWADASTFVINIYDGAGSELHTSLGDIMVGPLSTLHNQGCRPGVSTRTGEVLTYRGATHSAGLCNSALDSAGPIVAADGSGAGASGPFVAQFGMRPRIYSVTIDDPDHGDAVYGEGDTVTLRFDQATDRAQGVDAGDKAFVDSLFAFSLPLGLQYMGAWEDDSTFTVTVLSTLSPPMTQAKYQQVAPTGTAFATLDTDADGVLSELEFRTGYARVNASVVGAIRDRTSRSLPSPGMVPRTDGEALHRSLFPVYDDTTPRIVGASAADVDNGDGVYGAGDIITVHFSMGTDLGAVSGGKAFVDRLLSFEPPIGTDYSGEWLSDALFRVTALDTVGGELLLCNHAGCTAEQQSNVTIVGVLRNRGDSSPPTTSRAHLSGISGNAAPVLQRFEVSDPDNLDYVFSDNDQLHITFDRSSDLGAVEAKRARVDALFSFNIPLGEDYSGAWSDDSTFRITILETRYALPLINRTNVSLLLPVRNANSSSLPNNVTSATLHGDFGRRQRPRLMGFRCRRRRRRLGEVGGEQQYVLTFDAATNRSCNGGMCLGAGNATPGWSYAGAQAAVDDLFVFSTRLGASYSGGWLDGSTFEVTVLEPNVNVSYGETPRVGVLAANVSGATPLFNADGSLPVSLAEHVLLEGNQAELMAHDTDVQPTPLLPRLTDFVLHSTAGAPLGEGYVGANYTLLLTFNISADVAGATWRQCTACDGHDNISLSAPSALVFSASLGTDYSGEWLDRQSLLITVLALDPLTPPAAHARLGNTTAYSALGGRHTPPLLLRTDIGDTTAPTLLRVYADDPDDRDAVYSSGDTITLEFDRPTDRGGGARTGSRSFVDALLTFSETLAYDYSGEWLQSSPLEADRVFQITILQATCPGCTPMAGIATVKPQDATDIRTRSQSSPRASDSSPTLSGDYGKTRGPAIVAFIADDFDNGDDTFGQGDTLTVIFDLATDRGGVEGEAASVRADEMLLFSHSLGSETIAQVRHCDSTSRTISQQTHPNSSTCPPSRHPQ